VPAGKHEEKAVQYQMVLAYFVPRLADLSIAGPAIQKEKRISVS